MLPACHVSANHAHENPATIKREVKTRDDVVNLAQDAQGGQGCSGCSGELLRVLRFLRRVD